MIPNCRFCNNITEYSPLKEMEDFAIKIYYCFTCNAEYLFWSNEDLASWSIYIKISDKLYKWTVSTLTSYEIGDFIARLWYIKTPGIPGSIPNKNLIILKTFNTDIPEINPNNFKEKLSIYLLIL